MIRINLTLACFICSIVGLALIYLAALSLQPIKVDLDEISFDLVGRSVTSEGKIVYKKVHSAGHLFLTLEAQGSKIQVPIFAGLMNRLREKGMTEKNFSVGNRLVITGLVSEYKGQLQIIPRKVEDIRLNHVP